MRLKKNNRFLIKINNRFFSQKVNFMLFMSPLLFVILTFEHLQNNRLKMENKNHFFLISSNKNKNGS